MLCLPPILLASRAKWAICLHCSIQVGQSGLFVVMVDSIRGQNEQFAVIVDSIRRLSEQFAVIVDSIRGQSGQFVVIVHSERRQIEFGLYSFKKDLFLINIC